MDIRKRKQDKEAEAEAGTSFMTKRLEKDSMSKQSQSYQLRSLLYARLRVHRSSLDGPSSTSQLTVLQSEKKQNVAEKVRRKKKKKKRVISKNNFLPAKQKAGKGDRAAWDATFRLVTMYLEGGDTAVPGFIAWGLKKRANSPHRDTSLR